MREFWPCVGEAPLGYIYGEAEACGDGRGGDDGDCCGVGSGGGDVDGLGELLRFS